MDTNSSFYHRGVLFLSLSLIQLIKKYRKKFDERNNPYFHYVKKNHFNRSDIRNKKVMDLAGFYQVSSKRCRKT